MTFLDSSMETPTPTWWRMNAGPRPTSARGTYRAHTIDYVDQFYDLVRRWRLETAFSSSVMEKVRNPSFQKIVGMGPKVSGLIVSELRIHRDFLFMALPLIHPEEDPVPANAKGKPLEMINAWLSWAEH